MAQSYRDCGWVFWAGLLLGNHAAYFGACPLDARPFELAARRYTDLQRLNHTLSVGAHRRLFAGVGGDGLVPIGLGL